MGELFLFCVLLVQCVQHFTHAWHFVTPWTAAPQAPLSMGVPRQGYWSGLPFPPPGDLPDAGVKPRSPASPALAGRFFTHWATWKPQRGFHFVIHVKVLYGLTVICDPLLLLSPPQAPGLSNYPISLHLCHGLKGASAWEMLSSLPLRQIKTLLWIEALQGRLLCLVTLRTHCPIQQGLGENGYWKGLEMLLVQTEISYKCKIHPWFWRSSRKKKNHVKLIIILYWFYVEMIIFWICSFERIVIQAISSLSKTFFNMAPRNLKISTTLLTLAFLLDSTELKHSVHPLLDMKIRSDQ